jgi:CBS domain-containing protein
MRTKIPSCTLRTPVMEVARRMREEGVRHVVVVSAGSDLVAGVVTELDLLRALVEGRTDGMASDILSLDPPVTVSAADDLDATVALMVDRGIEFMVVMDGSPARPVGVLSAVELAERLAT